MSDECYSVEVSMAGARAVAVAVPTAFAVEAQGHGLQGPPGPPGPPGPFGAWTAMTQPEFEAIPVKDPEMLYLIVA